MNAVTSSSDLVHLAYRLLRRDSCYDKMDLFVRANVAAHETNGSFQKRQDTLAVIVDELRKGAPSPKSQQPITEWLKQVDFHLLPKSVDLTSAHERSDPVTGTKPCLISSKRIVATAKSRVFNVA